jgi:dephospho-CoA kinase
VVYDVPLLAESPGRYSFDAVVVVQADPELRVSRLEGRGMAREDAVARMAAQATDEQRRAIADEIVTNDGTFSQLREQVEAVWERLLARRSG